MDEIDMEKQYQQHMDNLHNITACIIAATIATQQVSDKKKQYVTEKGNEAFAALTDLGYSIKREEVDYQNPKLPDYIVTYIKSGEVAFKMTENYKLVTQWYYHFTS